jgi:nitrogen fixation/metabolism regulation signal transduction histidine kinase
MHSRFISSQITLYCIEISLQRSSKEFIQARIDSIISSRLGKTEEQSSFEADQLNHVKQREQEQHIDLSNSCSPHDASNLSADVADMVKRLKLARQQQREEDEHKVLPGTKHSRYREQPPGEAKKNKMSATFCEGCLHKPGACVCNESESYHTAIAIEISEDTEAVVASVSMHNQDLFAAAVDDNTESTLDDARLEGIENAVESDDQLVAAKVKKKKRHNKKRTKSAVVEVEEENNDRHTDTFRWRAFVIVALLLLIVSILIGLLFALARPLRTQP